MARAISSLTLFVLNLCLFLHFPSPTFGHFLYFPFPIFGHRPPHLPQPSHTSPPSPHLSHTPPPSPQQSHTPPPSPHPPTPSVSSSTRNLVIVEQICHHTRDPLFCKSLAKGDLSSINKVYDNSQTLRIFNNVVDIASRSKHHISQDLTCHNIKVEVKCALEKCLSSYTQAVASLKTSSPVPDVKTLEQIFKNADQSLWNCKEAVEKAGNDPPIAYVRAANHLIHYFISFGVTRTSFTIHPAPPTSEKNWGYKN